MTLGIIGLGKLGTRVGEIGKAFRMKVSVWSQNITQERADKAGFGYAATKEDLLRQSDIVSIHIPLTPKSRGLLGAKELALLKPTALLVNTSRGPIVDQAALLDVLRNKKIAGAGFDVYDVEPLPLDHPYRKMDNVVLTPHLGYCSRRTTRSISAAWSRTSAASSTASRCGWWRADDRARYLNRHPEVPR